MTELSEKWAALKTYWARLNLLYSNLRAALSAAWVSDSLRSEIQEELSFFPTAASYYNRAADYVSQMNLGAAVLPALAVLAILSAAVLYISNRVTRAAELWAEVEQARIQYASEHPGSALVQSGISTVGGAFSSPLVWIVGGALVLFYLMRK